VPDLKPLPDNFRPGDKALSADDLNKLKEATFRSVTGAGLSVQKFGDRLAIRPNDGPSRIALVTQDFVVLDELDDYLLCTTYDYPATPQVYDPYLGISSPPESLIYVAKPFDLQLTPWETTNPEYAATPINPTYVAGDIIKGVKGATGYTATTPAGVTESITWMDMNTAGRNRGGVNIFGGGGKIGALGGFWARLYTGYSVIEKTKVSTLFSGGPQLPADDWRCRIGYWDAVNKIALIGTEEALISTSSNWGYAIRFTQPTASTIPPGVTGWAPYMVNSNEDETEGSQYRKQLPSGQWLPMASQSTIVQSYISNLDLNEVMTTQTDTQWAWKEQSPVPNRPGVMQDKPGGRTNVTTGLSAYEVNGFDFSEDENPNPIAWFWLATDNSCYFFAYNTFEAPGSPPQDNEEFWARVWARNNDNRTNCRGVAGGSWSLGSVWVCIGYKLADGTAIRAAAAISITLPGDGSLRSLQFTLPNATAGEDPYGLQKSATAWAPYTRVGQLFSGTGGQATALTRSSDWLSLSQTSITLTSDQSTQWGLNEYGTPAGLMPQSPQGYVYEEVVPDETIPNVFKFKQGGRTQNSNGFLFETTGTDIFQVIGNTSPVVRVKPHGVWNEFTFQNPISEATPGNYLIAYYFSSQTIPDSPNIGSVAFTEVGPWNISVNQTSEYRAPIEFVDNNSTFRIPTGLYRVTAKITWTVYCPITASFPFLALAIKNARQFIGGNVIEYITQMPIAPNQSSVTAQVTQEISVDLQGDGQDLKIAAASHLGSSISPLLVDSSNLAGFSDALVNFQLVIRELRY
jgi:hypothetical protein